MRDASEAVFLNVSAAKRCLDEVRKDRKFCSSRMALRMKRGEIKGIRVLVKKAGEEFRSLTNDEADAYEGRTRCLS